MKPIQYEMKTVSRKRGICRLERAMKYLNITAIRKDLQPCLKCNVSISKLWYKE